jgi:thioredoxin-like negative regulator of GroEL
MFAQTLVLAVQGRLALERGSVNEAVRLLQQSVNAAWTSRNLITFSWALPYLAETMAAAGDPEQAAELLGFLLASSKTGSWMHARADTARHSLAQFEPQRIADGLERGSGLSIDEVAFSVLGVGTAIGIGNTRSIQ